MSPTTNPPKQDNDSKETQTSASSVGPWHFGLALLGIVPIVFLAGFTFRAAFTTAGDVLALVSYIAAVIAAAFGVQIAVRGAEASAENKANKDSALSAMSGLSDLKSDVDSLSKVVRTIGNSPPGQTSFFIDPGKPLKLGKRVEIPDAQLGRMQAQLNSIERTLKQIAR
jgi:hypothetical protein